VIGNTGDWLRLVFAHEYTHILHLDRSGGMFAGLRRVFGRHPFLMPNLYTPAWQIEGLATFEESAITGEGRLRAGDFRLMLNRASADGHFASLDRASNRRVDWPSGQTPYLYGAYFHQFLAEKYGDASVRKLVDATARRVPYVGSRAFKQVFGQSLGDLWNDFERSTARDTVPIDSPAVRLTNHGFVVSSPAYSDDGRLYYSISNPHEFPALLERAVDGSERQVATRVGGGRLAIRAGRIVFDQLEYVRSVALQSDLYSVAVGTGEVRRLTRELRAGDPDLSPDGRTIVCTIQSADRRSIVTLPLDGRSAPLILVSEDSTQYASPRWSPDGRTIAAERRGLAAPSAIVLIDAATGSIRTLSASSHGRSVNPAWTPDGRSVLFASDRDGGSFQIYSADVDTGDLKRLMNVGASADSPVISPDGRSLVFVGYTNDGFDLFAIRWAVRSALRASANACCSVA
jgi:dipeptidyl aminopeptidase/acylaminoacyl peptidase